MAYLHGVETIEQKTDQFQISEADISDVVVIGTMPTYMVDSPAQINKVVDTNYKSVLGENIDGFTIPDAVETILTESGGANIYTINIFDNDKHTANVDKTIVFQDGKCVLDEAGIQNLVLTKDEVELTLDEDYSFENNTITALEGGLLEDDFENVSASYKYADFTKITDSDVIGAVDKDGKRSGLQAILDIISEWGTTPGIIIVPGFVSKNVRNAVNTMAEKIKAYAYLDCPPSLSVNLAEKARVKETDGIDLTTTSERVTLLHTWVTRYNQNQNTTTLKPLSPVVAGLRVKLDRSRNCAKSIDNTASSTILGTEIPISFILDDPSTDANRLNAAGLTTVINYKGEFRIWGGRNTNFPKNEGIKTFESTRRTSDFIQISIQNSQFDCIGEKLTRAFIDDIINKINAKFDEWAGGSDPLIYGGEAYFDETLNTAENISNGHLYLPWTYCPTASAERITNLPYLDISIITKALSA